MAKLIMCLGLPGSGKSTWAADQVLKSQMSCEDTTQWIVVVNKDTIRRDFEKLGWVWSKEAEKDVIQKRDSLITKALTDGKDVISDDTNLAPKHQNGLKQLANKCRAKFEVKDFRDVPLETCVERDSQRTGKARVGRDVIVKMATTYLNYKEPEPKFAKYTRVDGLPNAVICDLDGTLSLFGPGTSNQRSPYDASNADKDEINWAVKDCLDSMINNGFKVIFMSGREDKFRPQTEAFLKEAYLGGPPLYMRKTGDSRKDWIVKGELFDAHIRGKYNVIFCLDDRDQVVKFYRSLGLTVFQVAEGNF